MSEKVLLITEAMRYWPSRKPRPYKINSFLGKIIVTNKNFYFLSSGGPEWDDSLSKIAVGGFAGLAVSSIAESYTVQDLDLSTLSNTGSLTVPLNEIIFCKAKNLFLLWYMGLDYNDKNGSRKSCTFIKEGALGKTEIQELKDLVIAAIDAL